MQPMKPTVGDIGGYSDLKCSLRVKVTSYREEGEYEIIGLKVVKRLECRDDCSLEIDEEFEMRRKIGGEDDALESLVFDRLSG